MPIDPAPQSYLVETYQVGLSPVEADTWADQLHREAGTDVHLVRRLLVPTDGCLLWEVTAPSVEAVHAMYARAGIPADRVSSAITHDEAAPRPLREEHS